MTCPASPAIVPMRQPTGQTCGQTCVAMLTGRTVAEVCEVMGKEGGTFGVDLVRALRALGRRCAERLTPIRHVRGLVPLGVVRLAPGAGQGGHWVLWTGGAFVDPAGGGTWAPEDMATICESRGWRMVSMLEVHP